MKNHTQKATHLLFLLTLIWNLGCTPKSGEEKENSTPNVEIVTNMGSVIIRLYDETPLHRDNFLKLVSENFYDSVLFHRVIQDFMIQAGDPRSKTAIVGDTLGGIDLPYKLPAEFHPAIFHKRGALGAARGNNPARASSSTQFYIVQGRVYTDSLLEVQLGRVNGWLAMNRVENDPENMELLELRKRLFSEDPTSDSIQLISEQLDELAKLELENEPKYQYPEEHSQVYKSVGGAAHLDQNYTVFGEVIEGMEIVDKIASSATSDRDQPLEDVRILTVKVIEGN